MGLTTRLLLLVVATIASGCAAMATLGALPVVFKQPDSWNIFIDAAGTVRVGEYRVALSLDHLTLTANPKYPEARTVAVRVCFAVKEGDDRWDMRQCSKYLDDVSLEAGTPRRLSGIKTEVPVRSNQVLSESWLVIETTNLADGGRCYSHSQRDLFAGRRR